MFFFIVLAPGDILSKFEVHSRFFKCLSVEFLWLFHNCERSSTAVLLCRQCVRLSSGGFQFQINVCVHISQRHGMYACLREVNI